MRTQRSRFSSGFLLTASIGVLAALAAGGEVSAQTAGEASAPVEVDGVVVTATRRAQYLQDTPLAVTAVTGEELERRSVVDTASLQRIVPSLVLSVASNETTSSTMRIRGVGTSGTNIGLEGAVGIYIDDVYRLRAGLALNNLFDVANVEVLRGPQGTLFGKNTSAGAISVTPNVPRLGAAQGMLKAGVGNYNAREAEFMANLPIGEEVAVRVAGAYQKRDGYVKDILSGAEAYDRDRQLIRAMILWAPNDLIRWRGTVDYSRKDEDCCRNLYSTIGAQSLIAASLVPFVLPTDPSDLIVGNTPGRPFLERTEDLGFSSHLEVDLGEITFKSIIAHRDFNADNDLDVDFAPADLVYQTSVNEAEVTSAEAQLSGQSGIVDWLVGAYYAEESLGQSSAYLFGEDLGTYFSLITSGAAAASLYPVGGGILDHAFYQEGTTWSVFTHNIVSFTDRLRGTLGLRYNHEEKVGGMSHFVVNSPSCTAPGVPAARRIFCPRPAFRTAVDESEVTGIVGLDFDVTDDIMVYASYSHGYKAGGINLNRDAPIASGVVSSTGVVTGTQAQIDAAAAFDPEFSDSYEVGIRSQFFNRALTLNATLFRTEFTGFQLNTFNGFGFEVGNAGTVLSEGVELDTFWRANDRLTFNAAVTFAEAEYEDDVADAALRGRRITNAPKWNASAGVHFEQPLSDGLEAYVDLDASYRSSYNSGSNLAPTKHQDGYPLFGARAGIKFDDEQGWDAYVWGTNLSNEFYQTVALDSFLQSGSVQFYPGAPRMFGVALRKKF